MTLNVQTPFIRGLNHLGLVVGDIQVAKNWFVNALGMTIIEDRGELVFLGAGESIFAIKTWAMATRKPEHGLEQQDADPAKSRNQFLDHYGFFASTPEQVDAFAAHITKHGAKILKGPYDRSDGRSIYFLDPCGMVGEYFFYSVNLSK